MLCLTIQDLGEANPEPPNLATLGDDLEPLPPPALGDGSEPPSAFTLRDDPEVSSLSTLRANSGPFHLPMVSIYTSQLC